jgi:hypothetical protein
VGVPGNVGVGAGYVPASAVVEMITYNKKFASFGRVIVWEATQAYANPEFLDAIKNALGGSTAAGPVSTSAFPFITPMPKTISTTSQISPVDPDFIPERTPASQSEVPASTTGSLIAEVALVNNEAAATIFQTVLITNNPLPTSDSAPATFKSVIITHTPPVSDTASTQTPEYKRVALNTQRFEATLEIVAPSTTSNTITITEAVSTVTRISTFYAASTIGAIIEASSETQAPTPRETQVSFQTASSTPDSAAEPLDLVGVWNHLYFLPVVLVIIFQFR